MNEWMNELMLRQMMAEWCGGSDNKYYYNSNSAA